MSVADKLTTIAENEQKVFDAGKEKYELDMWGRIQNYGNPTSYSYLSTYFGWDADTFKPKYDLVPTDAAYMFENFGSKNGFEFAFDMEEYLTSLGLRLDFSQCTNVTNFVLWTRISRLGVVDLRKCTSAYFYYSYRLHTVEKLILKEDGTQTSSFSGSGGLENITIEGKIGRSWNFKDCTKLTIASLKSIITALMDYAGTSNEYKYTLTLSNQSMTLLETEGATSPNENTWAEYIDDKKWNLVFA